MPRPVIVTCAPTGGIHTPTMSPHLPVTPDEIAAASIEAAEAGASIIHLHARNPDPDLYGKPDHRPETFMAFLPRIKQAVDAVVNVSTGAGLGMSMEQRLAAAVAASPEMASLNMGSMNFGIFPMLERHDDWQRQWEPEFLGMTRDFIFPNTFATLEQAMRTLGEGHGTRFEFECYDLGHLYNLRWCADQGFVKPPFFIQFVFGILGGMGAHPDHLTHLVRTAERLFGGDFEFSVLAAGRNQMAMATQAAMLGGNLRVGLEDSLWIAKGELATSNAQQVRKVVTILGELGLAVATPAEARARLGLKGGDAVGF